MPRAAELLLLTAVLSATPAAAQSHHGASPYADLHSREIKALSREEVEGLLDGEGLGFALAAELNGLPGPRHVLELADALGLTDEQRDAVTAIEREMRGEAVELGRRLVDAERALDALFRDGRATPEAVRAATGEAGRLRAELRAVHLLAHLSVTETLAPAQVEEYGRLRGYAVH